MASRFPFPKAPAFGKPQKGRGIPFRIFAISLNPGIGQTAIAALVWLRLRARERW